METQKPLYLNVEQAVDHILNCFGDDVKIGMPLGMGKPAALINSLYDRAKSDPRIRLTIFTSLSLEKPVWTSDLERRLLEPFSKRQWEGVPDLSYMLDLRKEGLPPNIKIHEVFFKAGAYRNNPEMQQNYINSNYTHTVRDIASNDNGVFAQMLAKMETGNGTRYSTSCNADCSLETVREFEKDRKKGKKRLAIGVVNTQLPFMYGDAEVDGALYDIIVDDPSCYTPLFGTPHQAISICDYWIGLNISTLIKDGGTLQIGIGALGDAIAYGLDLRHNRNDIYRKIVEESGVRARFGAVIDAIGGLGVFEEGLYGATEMLVEAFIRLYKNGVIKRKVYHHAGVQRLINEGRLKEKIPADILEQMLAQETIHPYLTEKDFKALQDVGVFQDALAYDKGWIVKGDQRFSPLLADAASLKAVRDNCLGAALRNGVILTGAFFIGPSDFYELLRCMPEQEQRQFEMTGVDVANQLYGNEALRTLQRREGRFCNTGMKATLLGAVVSDGLDDGTVVSGVGGQYNFVAMAHALPDARLLMMIKSTRQEGGKTLSNIVFNYGHVTIPRHLRDIIVTEYGIADIRGKCDQEIIKAMLNVADSRFQEELLAEARKHKKIPADYRIPEQFRNNTPERLSAALKELKAQGLFPDFPFGTEFTAEELSVLHALKNLKNRMAGPDAAGFPEIMAALPEEIPNGLSPMFERMGLTRAETAQEVQSRKTLMLACKLAGFF
jgi:acyl-CoA hydrolase